MVSSVSTVLNVSALSALSAIFIGLLSIFLGLYSFDYVDVKMSSSVYEDYKDCFKNPNDNLWCNINSTVNATVKVNPKIVIPEVKPIKLDGMNGGTREGGMKYGELTISEYNVGFGVYRENTNLDVDEFNELLVSHSFNTLSDVFVFIETDNFREYEDINGKRVRKEKENKVCDKLNQLLSQNNFTQDSRTYECIHTSNKFNKFGGGILIASLYPIKETNLLETISLKGVEYPIYREALEVVIDFNDQDVAIFGAHLKCCSPKGTKSSSYLENENGVIAYNNVDIFSNHSSYDNLSEDRKNKRKYRNNFQRNSIYSPRILRVEDIMVLERYMNKKHQNKVKIITGDLNTHSIREYPAEIIIDGSIRNTSLGVEVVDYLEKNGYVDTFAKVNEVPSPSRIAREYKIGGVYDKYTKRGEYDIERGTFNKLIGNTFVKYDSLFPPSRIDFIFAKHGTNIQVKVKESKVTYNINLSDHNLVTTTLQIKQHLHVD